MNSVPQFVRECHDIAWSALVVEQHVGVRRRDGRMRERAGRLAWSHRRVDPIVLEEALRNRRHFG